MEKLSYVIDNLPAVITSVVAILGGVYAIALIVPGEQPDKFIKSILDLTKKFSRK